MARRPGTVSGAAQIGRRIEDVNPKLLYIVTAPITARTLLRGQLRYMRENGFDVTLICGADASLEEVGRREGVRTIGIDISRSIRPAQDIRTLAKLVQILRDCKPHIVNASTPKAGLLGMLAAKALGIQHRIYVLRGLRLEGTTGKLRAALYASEWLAAACSHEIISVGESLRKQYITLGLAASAKISVFGEGSSNGVDVTRFERTNERRVMANRLRTELGIGKEDLVFGFVGRFTRDKGISDLVAAYRGIASSARNARLLLVGEFDDTDPIGEDVRQLIVRTPGIIRVGSVSDVAPYYGVMDVLVLPSYREGFPNVPLEAAAAGVPTVIYASTGCVDAVVDGVTGRVVPTGDVSILTRALQAYCDDSSAITSHGAAAELRVRQHFRNEDVWKGLLDAYRRRLTLG